MIISKNLIVLMFFIAPVVPTILLHAKVYGWKYRDCDYFKFLPAYSKLCDHKL